MSEPYNKIPISSELSHVLLSSDVSAEIATSDQGLSASESRKRFARDG
jgi:hypothetical protein